MKKIVYPTTLILIAILTLSFYISNCSSGDSLVVEVLKYDKSVVQNYNNYCAGCHGYNLEKFADDNWMFANSESEVIAVIKNGEEEMGMPAFDKTFSDKEIKALTDYIVNEAKELAGQKEYADYSERIANEEGTAFWAQTIVADLESPWGLEFLPDGNLLIAERNGTLWLFNEVGGLREVSGLPDIRVGGQGGLMDLQLHPEYASNGWIYISYSYFDAKNSDRGNTAIIRAQLNGGSLSNTETIYMATPTVSTKHHYGCRIEFDNDGYLYFSVGDRGRRDSYPQSTDNSNGKVHRLHDDGRIPEDNPFVNSDGAEKSIWSYGHRNIQGIAKHPVSGEIWTHEHGPKGGDEINIVEPGKNYGWPVISYGVNYSGTKFTDITHKEGMEQPLLYYVPSIAPCGMAFVTSTKYPGWENSLLIGSLRYEYLEQCFIAQNKVVNQVKLLENIGRVRNVKVSPDGYIYVAIESPGKILKLIPAEANK